MSNIIHLRFGDPIHLNPKGKSMCAIHVRTCTRESSHDLLAHVFMCVCVRFFCSSKLLESVCQIRCCAQEGSITPNMHSTHSKKAHNTFLKNVVVIVYRILVKMVHLCIACDDTHHQSKWLQPGAKCQSTLETAHIMYLNFPTYMETISINARW